LDAKTYHSILVFIPPFYTIEGPEHRQAAGKPGR